MIRRWIIALIFSIFAANTAFAQIRHDWHRVTLKTQLSQQETITGQTVISSVSVDSLYFSSHDSLNGFSNDMGRGFTTGVFFTVPSGFYPIVIKSLVVNFYGGSSSSIGGLGSADILALVWQNVTAPVQIADTNIISSSFTSTISVPVDQFMPVEFDFNDTASIATPSPFAVGIQYASTSVDTINEVSPGFGYPPAEYNDFYIDSTGSGSTREAVYYDHNSFWTDPTQIGNMSAYLIVEMNQVNTGITKERWHFPDSDHIIGNYPNPFNPQTVITINAPSTGLAHIEIYDILGRKIFSESHLVRSGEVYSFAWAPRNNSSGLYFVTVSIGKDRYFHKMTYIK